MTSPLVSIVISVYNAGGFLRPSVESILRQTYQNLEIIIIDDGSTDGCVESIADIKDNRIRRLTQQNAGKSVALNRALKMISGQFYAIQDADDISYPTRIERLVEAMNQNSEVAGVFSGYDLIINDHRVAPRFRYKGSEECKKDIVWMRMPSHDPTVMFRMSMVKDFEYEPDLKIGQGWDYILRAGEQFPLMVIEDCLYSYRINLSSNTREDANRRNEKVQAVFKRAFARRGKIYHPTAKISEASDVALYGVVSHFMESVLDLRRSGRIKEAFRTAWYCLKLHPLKMRYYKPLAYFIIPKNCIVAYRRYKQACIAKSKPDG